MAERSQADIDDVADAIDVHVLDITAQIEALLRGVREVQRGIISVHQSARRDAAGSPRTPASDVASRLTAMLTDCDSLKGAVTDAADRAGELMELVTSERGREDRHKA